MIRINRKVWIAALGAGAFASFTMLPNVHAELVYENGSVAAAPATAPATEPTQLSPQVDDRAALRETLESSEKARVTLQAQQAQPVQQAPRVQVAPVVAAPAQPPLTAPAPAVAAPAPAPLTVVSQPAVADAAPAPAPETQNMSKAELLRRERMRTELQNEDALQARLEELRLRDEQKRTGQILGTTPTSDQIQTGASAPAPAPAPANLQEQPVVAPVTEHPGQPAAAPSPAPASAQNQQQLASLQSSNSMDQMGVVGTSSAKAPDEPSEKTKFGLSGRAGLSNMSANGLGYSISPQFSAGLAASVAASDYVTVELGYTYSQYAVSMLSTNPLVNYIQSINANYGANSLQSINMNQNVFDAGLKLYVLGPDSMLRPFISGGAAYAKSYVNYNQNILNQINANPAWSAMGQDYNLNQYLGYLGAGMDIKLTRSISLGVDFKYFDVLASNEDNSLNNLAFYNNPSGLGNVTADKQYVGGSLSSANFYSILAGLTFNM